MVMESESFPVGTGMPSSTAKRDRASTARYSRASSPGCFAGHIQFALSAAPRRPCASGAQIRFVRASATLSLAPAFASMMPGTGA